MGVPVRKCYECNRTKTLYSGWIAAQRQCGDHRPGRAYSGVLHDHPAGSECDGWGWHGYAGTRRRSAEQRLAVWMQHQLQKWDQCVRKAAHRGQVYGVHQRRRFRFSGCGHHAQRAGCAAARQTQHQCTDPLSAGSQHHRYHAEHQAHHVSGRVPWELNGFSGAADRWFHPAFSDRYLVSLAGGHRSDWWPFGGGCAGWPYQKGAGGKS